LTALVPDTELSLVEGAPVDGAPFEGSLPEPSTSFAHPIAKDATIARPISRWLPRIVFMVGLLSSLGCEPSLSDGERHLVLQKIEPRIICTARHNQNMFDEPGRSWPGLPD